MSASLAMALVYALGQWTLSRRRRQWRSDRVNGVPVLVAQQDGPAVIGVLHPSIVLPRWALDLEPHAIDLMIRHERQHGAARDPLLMHLAGLALLAMPWNPAAWWMVARLRLAVEIDCDARVLFQAAADRSNVPPEASRYGELLLAVAARRSPRRRALVAPALLEHASSLRRRISAMYPRHRPLRRLRAVAAGTAAAVLFAIALVLPAPRLLAHPSTPVVRVQTAVAVPSVITNVDSENLNVLTPATLRRAPAVHLTPVLKRAEQQAGTPPVARGEVAQDDPVFQIGNDIASPILITKLDPTYTSAAMAAKIAGEVWLDGIVERDGTLSNVTVRKSLDLTFGLDQAAVDAAGKWKFKPGMKDGQPARVSVQLILEFRLSPRTTADSEFGKGAEKEGTPGLVLPVLKVQVSPTYTSDAMRAKLQGTVKIEAVVEADGTVGNARIVESLDRIFGLDEAALAAVKKWHFRPGTLDGLPVAVVVVLDLQFRLH
jgi:TonB family protein